MPLFSAAQMTDPFELTDEMFPQHLVAPEVVLYSERPSPEVVLEMHDAEPLQEHKEQEENPEELEITIDDLPGVKELDPELEQSLEVHDGTVSSNETLRADVDLDGKKSKKDPKWDWSAHGSKGFLVWVKEKVDKVPSHSGYDTSGLQRAVAFLEKLDDEISKAMRSDLDGELDANAIEKVRSEIDNGIERLHERLEKVRGAKGKGKKRKKANQEESDLVKTAQKSPSINGIIVTVPLLLSRIARVCINGMVSAGHDLEDLYTRQCEYYKLDRREKAELQQLLADMGAPIRQDRGAPENEDFDQTSSDNFDFAANYQS